MYNLQLFTRVFNKVVKNGEKNNFWLFWAKLAIRGGKIRPEE